VGQGTVLRNLRPPPAWWTPWATPTT